MARVSKAELVREVLSAVRAYLEEASNLEQIITELAGLGRTEVRCLGLLERHGGRLTAGRLAELSHLSTGAITGVVDRLEQAGLARREPDPHDRRRVIVVLNETAWALAEEALKPLVDAHLADLEQYTVRELEAIRSFMILAAQRATDQVGALKAARDEAQSAASPATSHPGSGAGAASGSGSRDR